MNPGNNCQPIMPKSLQNQTIFCPWTSRAPLATTSGQKPDQKPSEPANSCCGNIHQFKTSIPSVQQSSGEFFNFLRLMQLFPDVHPATLHTVLILCKSDFFRAVDKLLYAKRRKQMYNNRRNLLRQGYCCVGTNTGENLQSNGSTTLLVQGMNGQVVPLDVSLKKIHEGNLNERGVKRKSPTIQCNLKNVVKTKDPVGNNPTDLLPVTSPTCKLPICPLSPGLDLTQNLSSSTETS